MMIYFSCPAISDLPQCFKINTKRYYYTSCFMKFRAWFVYYHFFIKSVYISLSVRLFEVNMVMTLFRSWTKSRMSQSIDKSLPTDLNLDPGLRIWTTDFHRQCFKNVKYIITSIHMKHMNILRNYLKIDTYPLHNFKLSKLNVYFMFISIIAYKSVIVSCLQVKENTDNLVKNVNISDIYSRMVVKYFH